MEYIEDYDEQATDLVKSIDRMFKSCKEASEAEKQGLLSQIQRGIKELREVLQLFKSDLYLIPRQKEAEYKKKYDAYIVRLGKYDYNAKKLELIVKKDDEALLKMKNGYDETKYAGKLNGAT